MRFPLPIALALALALPLAGCGHEPPVSPEPSTDGAATADRAEIEQALAASPEVTDESAFTSEEDTAYEQGGAGLAAIRPLRFGRRIEHVERRFEFRFADPDSNDRPTTAHVTVHTFLTGSFVILAGVRPDDDGDGRPDSVRVVRKRLADHGVRRVLLKRVRERDDRPALWKIVAVSGLEITSRGAKTDILSLRIRAAALDTTIVSPLELRRLRQVLALDPHEEVELTVTTAAEDDVVVLVRPNARVAFRNNGDGTHTGRWRAGDHAGLHHLGVNALSHGTLFDDAEPYDSNAWLLPFVVRPTTLADALP